VRRSRLISAATAAALSFGVTVAATATTAQAATPATAASTDQSAVDALHAAEALFAPTATPFDSSGSAGAGSALKPDPTTTLAALAHVVGQLSGADRRTARAILARPTDGSSDPYHFGWSKSEIKAGHATCGPDLCVHWTDAVGGADDPRAADVRDADLTRGAGNGIPDQVDYTLHEMEHVWATEVTSYGYNAPKADNKGENLPDSNTDLPKIDIYLADVGAAGYYGFCAPEQNRRQSFGFCVLDNDYAPREFGHANTPLDNLRVTAAHEFFHDVQFNYDSAEDAWFMEATAAWMEDEVYPTVNDNLQYLKDSPFHYSYQSLDLRDRGYLSTYGSWVFFRFLSERYGRAIVRTQVVLPRRRPLREVRAPAGAHRAPRRSEADDQVARDVEDEAPDLDDPRAGPGEGARPPRDRDRRPGRRHPAGRSTGDPQEERVGRGPAGAAGPWRGDGPGRLRSRLDRAGRRGPGQRQRPHHLSSRHPVVVRRGAHRRLLGLPPAGHEGRLTEPPVIRVTGTSSPAETARPEGTGPSGAAS